MNDYILLRAVYLLIFSLSHLISFNFLRVTEQNWMDGRMCVWRIRAREVRVYGPFKCVWMSMSGRARLVTRDPPCKHGVSGEWFCSGDSSFWLFVRGGHLLLHGHTVRYFEAVLVFFFRSEICNSSCSRSPSLAMTGSAVYSRLYAGFLRKRAELTLPLRRYLISAWRFCGGRNVWIRRPILWLRNTTRPRMGCRIR